jgi:hypothetical protein
LAARSAAVATGRDADIRAANTVSMIACCNLLFRDALRHSPPPQSGRLTKLGGLPQPLRKSPLSDDQGTVMAKDKMDSIRALACGFQRPR